MKKHVEETAAENDNHSKTHSSEGRKVTTQINEESYAYLKKISADRHLSLSALINTYIEEAIKQQEEDRISIDIVDAEDKSTVDSDQVIKQLGEGETSIEIIEDSIVDSDEKFYFVSNPGIKYEKVGIESSAFPRIYLKSFITAVLINILGILISYYLTRKSSVIIIVAPLFPLFMIIWAILQGAYGSVRRDGSYIISAWAGLAGTVSALTAVIVFLAYRLSFTSTIETLVILLIVIIFIGLLVNVPIEVNIALNQRRIRKINGYMSEWGHEICQFIINREIIPDMTKEMVLLGWGEPTKVENLEATKAYTTEKWVFRYTSKPMYVWFTDGLVSKINDSGT